MQSEDLRILKLIKSLGVNYPIINYIGYAPEKLITLVVADHQLKNVCIMLSNYKMVTVTDAMSSSRVAEILCATNSEPVLIPYSCTRKGREIIRPVEASVQMGRVGDKKLRALPVLISDKVIRPCDDENLFVIYLQGDFSSAHLALDEVVPSDEQMVLVADKMQELDLIGKCSVEKSLLFASCFLYPSLKKRNTEEFVAMLCLASDLVQRDENNRDPYDACELFIEELYFWQERTQFQDVCRLPDLEMGVESRLNSIILFNDQFIYMKQQLFDQISENMLKIFSMDVLKNALVDEGILYPENSRTFTAKVGYRNIIGEYKRERMIRFRRGRLHRAGELDFIDLCLNSIGGRGDVD